ncbi:conserved hypothetical protein [Desulforapulum autotrophicum HRM2]|uniref:Uncharacterized protein n=1 Tax=Desulforapulum autotrophicum (strain ATCC 43914 / DSM 3382 / VKM B-1955 / HRM2) TaxID=177437 RepID=C0QHA0_DESAH|nr:hypothetical protein [Desulforapulum autotrophicum]ACN17759.1 conserved hypothetical protein [Desulforapulum autotrophicum HRM2]
MNLLDKISQMNFMHLGNVPCPMCRKKKTYFYATSKGVLGCRECIAQALQKQLMAAGKPDWTWERFTFALSSQASMADRLMALVHFNHFQGMAKLPKLLVDNLGFETDHPLSNLVRQKAFDACCTFKDRDRMLRPLLNHKKYTTWQQKANIARAAYCLAPTMARVKSLVIRIAKDVSPNVRAHVADIIQNDTNGWARSLFEELSRDKNPLVREACLKKTTSFDTMNAFTKNDNNTKKKTRVGSNSKAPPKKKTRPHNPIENRIKRSLTFPSLEKIYERYLAHIPDLLDPKQYAPGEIEDLKKNTQESLVHLLGQALGNKMLFAGIVERLPKRARDLLYICKDKTYGLDLYMAELKRIQAMEEAFPPAIDEGALYKKWSKDPDFFFFVFNTRRSYSGYRTNKFEIGINPGLLPYILKVLPDPDPPLLAQVQEVEKKVDHLFMDNQEIFKTLPIILSFIAQDKIKYAKNSDKILAGSLKRMAETCKITEFYTEGDKDVRSLKTRLIADFFTSRSTWKPSELSDLPGFIKTGLNDYFAFKEFKSHRCRDTFEYIKRQSYDYNSDNHEKQIRSHLKKILELLPDKEWASVCNLARIGEHAELNFSPFSNGFELGDLYIPMDTTTTHRKRDQVGYTSLYCLDTTTLPFIRRMMFLFGALGILDLAYSKPTNPIYREYKKPYLSPFDGLKYVRLTEFGRYALDRTQRFTTDITAPSGEIEVDANNTLLSIQGQDPIKRMILEAVGEPINQSSYRVDFNSFLQECTTATEVKNKITFFRENIAEHPPAVWERFFENLLNRLNPIKPVPALSVFKIKPDRELLSLLTSDSLLKKYVMRAENHHMVVEKTHLSKVKKRLAQFGYFVG